MSSRLSPTDSLPSALRRLLQLGRGRDRLQLGRVGEELAEVAQVGGRNLTLGGHGTETVSGAEADAGLLTVVKSEGGIPDAELAALVAAWPTLPDHIRAAVRALVGIAVPPTPFTVYPIPMPGKTK